MTIHCPEEAATTIFQIPPDVGVDDASMYILVKARSLQAFSRGIVVGRVALYQTLQDCRPVGAVSFVIPARLGLDCGFDSAIECSILKEGGVVVLVDRNFR